MYGKPVEDLHKAGLGFCVKESVHVSSEMHNKQTSFKQHGLVFWLSTWEAKQPYKWKHANLQEIRKFLLSEVEAGRYCPVLDLWSSHAMPSEMYHRIH